MAAGINIFNVSEFVRIGYNLTDGQCVKDILDSLGIEPQEMEGVFVNGRIAPLDTLLRDGDRIAALPPGTPLLETPSLDFFEL